MCVRCACKRLYAYACLHCIHVLHCKRKCAYILPTYTYTYIYIYIHAYIHIIIHVHCVSSDWIYTQHFVTKIHANYCTLVNTNRFIPRCDVTHFPLHSPLFCVAFVWLSCQWPHLETAKTTLLTLRTQDARMHTCTHARTLARIQRISRTHALRMCTHTHADTYTRTYTHT